jgi:hypothetical protein
LESQVEVLKEEIRRLERNQKRYDGINLEYLKNIMVSFLEAENEKDRKPLLQVCTRIACLRRNEARVLGSIGRNGCAWLATKVM